MRAGEWVRVAALAALAFPALALADVVTFKEGSPAPFGGGTYTAAEDVMLVNNAGGAVDQNFGGRADFEVGESPSGEDLPRHTLLRFDVTALNGHFATITGVTLRLFPTLVGAAIPDSLQAFRLASANTGWVEGTGITAGFSDPSDNGQSTWGARVQGSQQWAGFPGASIAGLDYTSLLASTTFDSSTPTGSAFDLVFNPALVQGLIQDWAGGNNSGLFLRTAAENNRNITFSSAEASTQTLHPELIITFTVPEPAGMLLLVGLAGFIRRRR